jgi:hypothetical protein
LAKHCEKQFAICWQRLVDERKRLIADGKIPEPKIKVDIIAKP